jgi:hypothetical protein
MMEWDAPFGKLMSVGMLLVFVCGQIPPALALEPGKHYELDQLGRDPPATHTLFDGTSFRTTFTNKVVLLSHAPEWQICLYNPVSKRIYKTTEANFRKQGLHYASIPTPVLKPPLLKRHYMFHDLHITETSCIAHDEEQNLADIWFRNSTQNGSTTIIDKYRYAVVDGNWPISACHILQDIYRLPVDSHLPLDFVAHSLERNSFTVRLRTASVAIKEGRIDVREPTDCKVCFDAMSVWVSPGERGNFEAAAKELLQDAPSKQKAK